MSKTKDKEPNGQKADENPKTLSLGGKGTLSLKGGMPLGNRAGSSAGIAVEVRRKRAAPGHPADTAKEHDDLHLTSDEREARARALRESITTGESQRTSLPKRRTVSPPGTGVRPDAGPGA